jgi:hypothetical protein
MTRLNGHAGSDSMVKPDFETPIAELNTLLDRAEQAYALQAGRGDWDAVRNVSRVMTAAARRLDELEHRQAAWHRAEALERADEIGQAVEAMIGGWPVDADPN